MTFGDAVKALEQGSRVRCMDWHDDAYIYYLSGQVMDQADCPICIESYDWFAPWEIVGES